MFCTVHCHILSNKAPTKCTRILYFTSRTYMFRSHWTICRVPFVAEYITVWICMSSIQVYIVWGQSIWWSILRIHKYYAPEICATLGYRLDDRRIMVGFQAGSKLSLLYEMSRRPLQPILRVTQWVPVALSLEVKGPGMNQAVTPI